MPFTEGQFGKASQIKRPLEHHSTTSVPSLAPKAKRSLIREHARRIGCLEERVDAGLAEDHLTSCSRTRSLLLQVDRHPRYLPVE
ncbi:MAG: hypothetical protein WCA06_00725, partial [Terrimicrobiaceae bacterium]